MKKTKRTTNRYSLPTTPLPTPEPTTERVNYDLGFDGDKFQDYLTNVHSDLQAVVKQSNAIDPEGTVTADDLYALQGAIDELQASVQELLTALDAVNKISTPTPNGFGGHKWETSYSLHGENLVATQAKQIMHLQSTVGSLAVLAGLNRWEQRDLSTDLEQGRDPYQMIDYLALNAANQGRLMLDC